MISVFSRPVAPCAGVRLASSSLVPPLFALSTLAAACAPASAAEPMSLPPVTVTATRFADDAARLPFGVSVITADQIRDAGVTTVNEAVMKLLGVPGRLDFYGGGDYQLDLRGFGGTAGSNQVVIVDGVRISEADLSGTRLAGIAIDSVERIEVVRGSGAVLYGEGATAGAVIITTKAASGGKARPSGAQGYVAMGRDNLLEVRSSAQLAAGGFSLDVAAHKRSTDGHRNNFRSNVEGASVAGQWRNEWLRVGASHARDKLGSGLPGALTAAEYAQNPRQSTHPDDRVDLHNQRDGVFGEATFGAWQIAADVGRREKSLVNEASFTYAYDVDANSRNLRARHEAALGAYRNALTAGVEHNDWTRVVAGAFGSTAEQESRAYYVKDDFTLPGGTRLSVGARRERADKTTTDAPGVVVDERFTAWDVGVVQPVGRDTSLYARGGRSFRFPNVDEIGFVSPGATLRPQTSRDVDVGARTRLGDGRAELRYYRNALRNEIGFDPAAPDPYGGFGANVNFTDPTLRQGLELELQQPLARTLEIRVNGALRQAKFTGGARDGNNIALTARRSLSVAADWEPLEGHRLAAMVTAVSSQSPDFENSCRMPSYTTTDLRYAYRNANVELALGMANLADKKYYTQAFRCVDGEPSAIYPEAGRSLTLSVRVAL